MHLQRCLGSHSTIETAPDWAASIKNIIVAENRFRSSDQALPVCLPCTEPARPIKNEHWFHICKEAWWTLFFFIAETRFKCFSRQPVYRVSFGSQTATATQRECINDDNGNGTVACLFCLAEQAVNQMITAILYRTNREGTDFGGRGICCPRSRIRWILNKQKLM
jgi:hypothetical protein